MNLLKGILLDGYHLLADGCSDRCKFDLQRDRDRESHKEKIDIKKATASPKTWLLV